MAALHPQIVHFTIVLVIVGVAFRLVSLLDRPRLAFTGPAAATLLILAAAAAVISVRSGDAAHGPVERAPGARPAVTAHEEWGDRTQIVLLLLGAIELAGLVLRNSSKAKVVRAVAAVVGLASVYAVYETAEHGGALVYGYAGGVGIRSGDPKDVERLLLAGYYHQAMADRAAGHAAGAAALIAQAAQRFPSDPEVQLLAADSLLRDQQNPMGAIAALAALHLPDDNRFMHIQRGTLQADAYEAVGQKDAAIAALETVTRTFPNARLQRRLDALKGRGQPAR